MIKSLIKIMSRSDNDLDLRTPDGIWRYIETALAHIGLGLLIGLSTHQAGLVIVTICYLLLQLLQSIKDEFTLRTVLDVLLDCVTFIFGGLIGIGAAL